MLFALGGCCGLFGLGVCPSDSSSSSLVASVVTLDVASSRVSVLPGGTVSTTLSVSVSGGATGAALTVGGGVSTELLASISPTTIPTGTHVVQLTVLATSLARPGSLAQLQVRATSTGGTPVTSAQRDLTVEVTPPFSLAISSQTVNTGASLDIPVAISRAIGFAGTIALAVDTATIPAGSSLVLSPASVTGSSTTMQLRVPPTAATGLYLVRTMGSFGASADTVRWLLRVVAAPLPPDIAIAAAPANATVSPGGSATFDLALTRSSPGLGDIALAIIGVPTGVVATFAPQQVAGTSAQLSLETANTTPFGSYPLEISATVGALVRRTTVTLVVSIPPDFSLSATPAALTLAPGASGQSTIAVQRTGLPGAVALVVENLPPGVSASIIPDSTSGANATLRLAVDSSAKAGIYSLAVRGTAGSIVRTTPIVLTIPVAPPTSSIAIQLVTTAATIAPGTSARIPIRLTRTGVFVNRSVELRVAGSLPGGAAWISPVITSSDSASLLVIGGTVGVYPISVSVALGPSSPTAAATITVAASSAPDFALRPQAREFHVTKGDTSNINTTVIDILRTNGFAGNVDFAAAVVTPADFTVTFIPAQTVGGTVRVHIVPGPNARPGANLLVIRGTSGTLVRETAMTIMVPEDSGYTPPGVTRQRP